MPSQVSLKSPPDHLHILLTGIGTSSTEPGCPRLDSATALTVPLTQFSKVDEVYQLLVDMRQANVLPKWKSVVVIYDKAMGEAILKAVVDSLLPNEMFPDLATAYFTVDSRNPAKS